MFSWLHPAVSYTHLDVYKRQILWSVAFALYALTAPPSISEIFSDSLECQLVVPSFGITHPTGYPFYTLLGGLWSRFLFPFANWAWRMNLFSALAAATAITLLALLGQRLMPAPAGTVRIPWAAPVSYTHLEQRFCVSCHEDAKSICVKG